MRTRTVLFTLLILLIFLAGCQKDSRLENKKIEPTLITARAIIDAPVEPGCVDSDNGITTSVKGAVAATLDNGAEVDAVDKCLGTFLVEQYCEGKKPANKNIRCEKGCKNRACQ